MAWTLNLNLAGFPLGIALSAQLVIPSGGTLTTVGEAITSGFVEVGDHNYYWRNDNMPDGFQGGIIFTEDGQPDTILGFLAVNPQEIEYVDVPVSTRATGTGNGDLVVEVTVTNDLGAPIPNLELSVWNTALTALIAPTVPTNADGQVQFSLASGDYKIVVRSTPQYAAIAPVLVQVDGAESVGISLTRAATVVQGTRTSLPPSRNRPWR